MRHKHTYSVFVPRGLLTLNLWDVSLLFIFIGLLVFLAWGAMQLSVPYDTGQPLEINLAPVNLPYYAACSVLRMLVAMLVSVLTTLLLGTLAAKSARAEKVIIPLVDILQSVPILGFLTFSVLFFVQIFPGSLLGPQCAAIFAIFTSQVWNMILSFYNSLKMIPPEIKEAARMFQLSAWRQFWQIEVPFALPALIWNAMVSMSAGWFFVVASEAVYIHSQTIYLPGIGSYITEAIEAANPYFMSYAVLTMLIVIVIYDQIIFRPLLAWSSKFRAQDDYNTYTDEAWFLTILTRSRFVSLFSKVILPLRDAWLNCFAFPSALPPTYFRPVLWVYHALGVIARTLIPIGFIGALYILGKWMQHAEISIAEVGWVGVLGLLTLLKVIILIILASLIWIPVGVWIGLNPRLTRWVQPFIQFLAAFPCNLLYPFFTIGIITLHLNPTIWTAPLMIMGTQWYLLFNIIAATTVIPMELQLAAKNYQVKGVIWWKRFMLPAIFPYYITGAITAAGGCWNASIVAEVVNWGPNQIEGLGLGSYIVHATESGDFPRLALGIGMMCLIVTTITHFFWQKLYQRAQERYDG